MVVGVLGGLDLEVARFLGVGVRVLRGVGVRVLRGFLKVGGKDKSSAKS